MVNKMHIIPDDHPGSLSEQMVNGYMIYPDHSSISSIRVSVKSLFFMKKLNYRFREYGTFIIMEKTPKFILLI